MREKPGRFNHRFVVRQIPALDAERPVLIAGPTASGKSALAEEIAAAQGGVIVNADALQVFADWRVLTARPSAEDEARLPHRLYGHVPGDVAYSVGAWLREVAPLLAGARPILVGGTGLYFTRLTEGLAEIPPVPASVRDDAARRLREAPDTLLAELDAATRARIDVANPARVRRAWEVLCATGRGLACWQDETPPPLLPLAAAQTILLDVPRDDLVRRIEARTDRMLASGALDEARANLATFHPARPSAKAIGAAALVAHLRGEIPLETARAHIILATRRYAKRQRTWFRGRMGEWRLVAP